MLWPIVAWAVLPTGAVLSLMFLSGQTLAMSCASRVLHTPVRLGTLQLSLATLMTGLCSGLSALTYSSLRQHEARTEEMRDGPSWSQGVHMREQNQLKCFLAGRNYYMSLCGLILWVTAWRLKALHDSKQLGPPRVMARPVSFIARTFYIALSGLALASADVPMCRINYNLQLAMFVTPQKTFLQREMGQCEAVFRESAGGRCKEWCDQVASLSQERLATILSARRSHYLGRYAAQFFDDTRGVEQGDSRIEDLFQKKTCAQVLRSVDKSNVMVNWTCIALAFVAIVGAFSFASNAWYGRWYGGFGGAGPDWYDMAAHED